MGVTGQLADRGRIPVIIQTNNEMENVERMTGRVPSRWGASPKTDRAARRTRSTAAGGPGNDTVRRAQLTGGTPTWGPVVGSRGWDLLALGAPAVGSYCSRRWGWMPFTQMMWRIGVWPAAGARLGRSNVVVPPPPDGVPRRLNRAVSVLIGRTCPTQTSQYLGGSPRRTV